MVQGKGPQEYRSMRTEGAMQAIRSDACMPVVLVELSVAEVDFCLVLDQPRPVWGLGLNLWPY